MNIEQKAIEYFGVTNNFKESGYITVSGQLLDLSGKNDGASGGYIWYHNLATIKNNNQILVC